MRCSPGSASRACPRIACSTSRRMISPLGPVPSMRVQVQARLARDACGRAARPPRAVRDDVRRPTGGELAACGAARDRRGVAAGCRSRSRTLPLDSAPSVPDPAVSGETVTPGSTKAGGRRDGDQRGADRDGVWPGLGVQRGHRAREGDRHLDGGLRGLDLDHGLVDLHVVAELHVPGDDLGLGEALAEVGQQEVRHVVVPLQPTRRRPGCGRRWAGGAPRASAAGRGCRTR